MNKFLQWLVNIAVGIVSFVFFLLWLFPLDQVVRHFISRLEEDTKGAYRVTVGEIKAGVFFKTTLTDFSLYHRKAGNVEQWVQLPKVRVGVRYLPLLAGSFQTSFDAKGLKGTMEGNLTASPSEFALDATLSEMAFNDLPVIPSALGLPLKGTVSGLIDLRLPLDRIEKGEGEIDLDLKDWTMSPKKWALIPGIDLDLPETQFVSSKPGKLKLKMGDGKVDVTSLSLTGEDLIVALKGKIQMNKKIELSRANLDGTFRFSGKMEKSIDWLVAFITGQKKEDGSFPLSLTGRLGKPRVQIGTYEIFDGNKFKMPAAAP